MKKIILVLALTMSLNAGWESGSDLIKNMNEYKKYENGQEFEYVSAGLFSGYISGVRDTLIDAGYICTPSGADGNQIFHIVIKWIENNPEKWNGSAISLIATPLLDAFPCKKKK